MKVYIFDIDQNKSRAKELGVKGLPFVTIFKNGEQIKALSAEGMPKNAKVTLADLAKSAIAL
jgi:thioredoxin-like negative regulator of GroEL